MAVTQGLCIIATGKKFNSQTSRQFQRPRSKAFEESRRRKGCHRCGAANWNPAHRCAKGAIYAHTRNRLKNGESFTHIIAEFVKELEGELTDGEDSRHDGDENEDLAVFDSRFISQPEEGASLTTFSTPIEETEEEIYIVLVSAGMKTEFPVDAYQQDFGIGDEE